MLVVEVEVVVEYQLLGQVALVGHL